MKRLVLILTVLAMVGLEAQQSLPKLRGRWSRQTPQAAALPLVTITAPTLQPVISVASSSLILEGLAQSTSGSPITQVTWVNDRGGSGTAIYDVSTQEWVTSGDASAQVKAQDTFTGGSNTALAGLTASPVGGVWAEVVNTPGSLYFLERRLGGWVQINSGIASATLINTVTPSPALAGTNYDVAVELDAIGSADGDDGAAIVFGYADSNNYCVAMVYGPGASTDVYLVKNVAGAKTTLGSANIDPAAGDVLLVEIRGTGLTVKQNGISRISGVTDADCDNAVGVGLGVGAFRGIAGDDASAQWHFDNFTVTDQDGTSGAITLQTGVNVLTVTATDGQSNVGTDVLTVTFAAPDTQAPNAIISSPTSNPTYVTGTAEIAISGTVSDNTEPTSCSLASPQSTPTTASCPLTGTGTSKTFTCDAVTMAAGSNTHTVTCVDAATNSGQDVLTATLSTADVTPPTITITTNGGGNFSTSTSPVTIAGTASDDVGLASVTGSCSPGTAGTVSGTTSWSASVTLAAGANTCIFTARDTANNTAGDSITVTLNVPLNITTNSLPPATQSAAYSQTLNVVGGTAPYTWDNNAGGSSLGGGACTGLTISSAGVVSGTPTTTGTCNFTAKVTDNVAATDTQPLSITVQATGAAGPHDYYDTLIARGDCFKAYSLRPLAGQTTAVNVTRGVADCVHGRWVNQISAINSGHPTMPSVFYPTLAVDTDPQEQDALKTVIPVFNPVNFFATDSSQNTSEASLAEAVSSSDTVFDINMGGQSFSDPGRSFLVGGPWPAGEIMTMLSRVGSTVTVARGQFGTTATSHSSGTVIRRNGNGLPDGRRTLAINTDGSISATYLFTWDSFWTDSYVNIGLDAHKLSQLTSHNTSQQLIEYKPIYSGITGGPSFTPATDVAATTIRWYSQSLTPGFNTEPGSPLRDENNDPTTGSIIKPNLWNRVWVLVEANSETDDTKFVDSGQDLVSPGGINNSTTSIVISHDLGSGVQYTGGPIRTNLTNPFTSGEIVQGASWPGRAIKIDSEIMTIVTGTTSGATRTLTVLRAQHGTTAAAHSEGAAISVIDDYVTVWTADENNNARMIVNRISLNLPNNHATDTLRGSISAFWIEWNTSQQQLPVARAAALNDARNGDLVGYQRNLVVLKNPASCSASDCSALLTRPVR